MLEQRSRHYESILSSYTADIDKCYSESIEKLKNFDIVREEMSQWKAELLSKLNHRKETQIKMLDDVLASSEITLSNNFVIKLPKVTALRGAAKISEKANELIPTIVLKLAAAPRSRSRLYTDSTVSTPIGSLSRTSSLLSLTSSIHDSDGTLSYQSELPCSLQKNFSLSHSSASDDADVYDDILSVDETYDYATSGSRYPSLDSYKNQFLAPKLHVESTEDNQPLVPKPLFADETYDYASNVPSLDTCSSKAQVFAAKIDDIHHDVPSLPPKPPPCSASDEPYKNIPTDYHGYMNISSSLPPKPLPRTASDKVYNNATNVSLLDSSKVQVLAPETNDNKYYIHHDVPSHPPKPLPRSYNYAKKFNVPSLDSSSNAQVLAEETYDQFDAYYDIPSLPPKPPPHSSDETYYYGTNVPSLDSSSNAQVLAEETYDQFDAYYDIPSLPPKPPPHSSDETYDYSTNVPSFNSSNAQVLVAPESDDQYDDVHVYDYVTNVSYCQSTDTSKTQQKSDLTKHIPQPDDEIYTEIDILPQVSSQVPPQVPPRRPFDYLQYTSTKHNHPRLPPEEEMDHYVDLKRIDQINLETHFEAILYEDSAEIRPFNVVSNGYLAERLDDSVALEDVCISFDGKMIFSDPANNCLRILTDTSENSVRITKFLKIKSQSKLGTLAYDHHTQTTYACTDDSLYQIQINKNSKAKPLVKGITPKGIACSSISTDRASSSLFIVLWTSEEKSICCYNLNGDFSFKICLPCIEKLPFGLEYNAKGYLIVSTQADGCLAKISTRGYPLWEESVDARKPGILNKPHGIAILPNEFVAVTEYDAHRVAIFSDVGKLMMRFGKEGSEPGNFKNPRGIAVRLDKELVVVDSGNRRIQLFTLKSIMQAIDTDSILV
jgi:hypothetical protein